MTAPISYRFAAVPASARSATNGTVPHPSTYDAYRIDPASVIPPLVPAGAGVGRI
jgi:hypothetical protein